MSRKSQSCLSSMLALPDDDEVMVKRKQILLWFFLVPFVLGAVGAYVTKFTTAIVGSVIVCAGNGFGLVWLFVNKKPSDTFIELVGYADLIAIILVDFNNMGAMLPRLWALGVLVVDVFLVCRIKSRSSIVVISVLCFWLVFSATEQVSRFGLLDIGDGDFNGDHDYRWEETCNCTNLPCARGFKKTGLSFILMIVIFLLDYYFTRGFANEVLAEKQKLELGVLAARDVASFLAGFKLEEADAHLDLSKEDLPEKLHEALHTILVNLRSYKPYLPQSCLQGGDDSASSEEGTSTQSRSQSQSESHALTPSIQSDLSNASKKLYHALAPTRATMLVMNMKNSIAAAEADHAEFSRLHAKVIGFALHAVRAQKGMLDLFVGDHVHASFNASKRCMQHAVAAVKTATTLRQGKGMEVNVAVCGGKVLAGDLGNNEVRRFSIFGHASVLTSVYERLGAEWGIGVVCNTAAYMDASVTQEMRIVLKAVTFVKHAQEKEAILWEAVIHEEGVVSPPVSPPPTNLDTPSAEQCSLTPRSGGRSRTHSRVRRAQHPVPQHSLDQEWMYALEESVAKHWVKYNEAAKLYLQGDCFEDGKKKLEAIELLSGYSNEPLATALFELLDTKTPVVRKKYVY